MRFWKLHLRAAALLHFTHLTSCQLSPLCVVQGLLLPYFPTTLHPLRRQHCAVMAPAQVRCC